MINVYDLDGKVIQTIELPEIFNMSVRLDIIRKVIKAYQSNRRQPYGVSKTAGKRHVAYYWGKGLGISRIPRLATGRGSFVPIAVGGYRAHPPKVEKNWTLKINKKEKKRAFWSALSALKDTDLIKSRGHIIDENFTYPLIVIDDIENISKTTQILNIFSKLGLMNDLDRAKKGKHIRAGKGKLRGRKYKIPKSVLIVANHTKNLKKSCGNLVGVDVVNIRKLNVENLAPGCMPGRATLFTKSALDYLKK